MDTLIAITFSEETRAVDALPSLCRLRDQGEIEVYDAGIVAKDTDLKLSMEQIVDKMPEELMWGSLRGSFIGLLGGPVDITTGPAGGLAAATLDLGNVGLKKDVIDQVGQALKPNNSAVVALVGEESNAALDQAMAPLGGRVLRTVIRDGIEKHIEAQVKADEDTEKRLNAELAQAKADAKDKIQQQLDGLRYKRDLLRTELDARKQRIETNIEAVKREMSGVAGEMKVKLEQRLKRLQEKDDRQDKLQALL